MSGQVEGGAAKTKRSVQNAQRCRLSSNLIKFNLGNSVATPTPQLLQLSWAEQQQRQQQRKIPKFWFNFFCVADSMEEIVIPLGEMSVTRMPFKFRWHLFSLENKLSLCVCVCVYECVGVGLRVWVPKVNSILLLVRVKTPHRADLHCQYNYTK